MAILNGMTRTRLHMSSRKTSAVLAAICIVSIIFSGSSVYLILNSTRVQQEQLTALQGALDEAKNQINEVESSLSDLTQRMSNISQGDPASVAELNAAVSALSSDLSDLSSELFRLEEALSGLLNQTPASIYDSAHKSVVVIRTPVAQGSGFLYNESNRILTNWHVVEDGTSIEVEFYDGTREEASLVGSDAYADVAVITVPSTPADARPLPLGDSSELYIGQQVVAIGNPLGFTGSLSSGYISQINMDIDLPPIVVPVIQLDITIAPGSSGGPLLDLSGNVVGITNAGTDYGFNFAVPSNIVKRVSSSLVETGEYEHPFVGFVGIELNPENIEDINLLNVEPFQTGLLIWEVVSDTPAAEAGLQAVTETRDSLGRLAYMAGDIILAVDDQPTPTFAEWSAYIEEYVSAGQTITLSLWRSGTLESLDITTTSRPPYTG